MYIISDPAEFKGERSAVAVGKFDGVHLGHRRLICEMVEWSEKNDLASVVFTFDPPPAVLFGGADAVELSTKDEKRAVFESLGVDVLVEFPFNKESAAIEAEDFLRDMIAGDLKAKAVFCGADVSFGAGGRGGIGLLSELSQELGFSVHVVDKLCAGGIPISSTRIRQAIREGRTDEARLLLGAEGV